MASRNSHPTTARCDQSSPSSSGHPSRSPGLQNGSGSYPSHYTQPRGQQTTRLQNTTIQLESAALKDFASITIILGRVPQDITIEEIWNSLTPNNLSITRIELEENDQGQRTGKAKVIIDPPPSRWPPWSGPPNVCVIARKDSSLVRFPILSTTPTRASSVRTPANRYVPRQLELASQNLLLGMMAHESAMFNLPQDKYEDVGILVKFFRKEFEITFTANFGRHGANDFKVLISFSHIKKILRVTHENGELALVILLPNPPKFYCLSPVTHDDTQSIWQDWDLWVRQTDIAQDKRKLKGLPAGLVKQLGESADIGRWTTYYFRLTPAAWSLWERIHPYLSDYNIKTEVVTGFNLIAPGPTNVWELLDDSLASLSLEILHTGHSFHLPFEVRYQLEVCISHGILNEYSIGAKFLEKLFTFETDRAIMMLEGVAETNTTIYDPMKIFEDPAILHYWPNARVPAHATMVRRAVVTPTTVYFKTPCVELTNRILRRYSDLNDRFLRVQFTDEMSFGKIYSSQNSKKDDNLYLRVHRVMSNGIVVGDRRYRFLAFSNSQFREHGAFFFCETDHVTCDSIRDWMGDFQHIRSVGKFAARMGQCFTTTRQVNGISVPSIRQIADIHRETDDRVWNFTDGIGKISIFFAKMIASDRGLSEVPSCFQMRMGGCKGVLTVWPDVPPSEVHIRPSQEKFKAAYNGLEIIKTSSYSHATLNKQIIPILSALGVDDSVFDDMLDEELKEYDDGLIDPLKAGELLQSRVDENQTTLIMAEMVDTFMHTNEPFVCTLLELWKSWVFKRLKYKAAISVKESAMVYGIVDEVGVLRGHSKKTEGKSYNRIDALPQIFLQVPIEAWDGSLTTNYKVITGLCVVGRNPSLHPGDVRVVQAVDAPGLRHLKNVVVFPQTGDRDIPSMCSGGDMDGDDYFVFWDGRLIPNEWYYPPLDHDASSDPPRPDGPTDVSISHVISFFAQYMKNDSLGAIATAHFAQADRIGVKHSRCIELAKLHSKAADYIKSGSPAVMDKHLRPRRWPHWMEKKPAYQSESAVGRIYDRIHIKTVEWHPAYDRPFDKRILSRYQPNGKLLAKASDIKSAYDIAMRRLMGQHEASITEFEVWSTFVLSRPRVGSDYKLQESMGREISALKERFRAECIEAVTGVEQKHSYASAYATIDREQLDRFVAAMYTVTYDQVQAALRERSRLQPDAEGEREEEGFQMPLISFPWLFHRELARVALGRGGDVRPLRRPAWAAEQSRQSHQVVHDGEPAAAATPPPPGDEGIFDVSGAMEPGDSISDTEGKQPEMLYELRSKKEGGGDVDGDEDPGEDYVRTSSGKVIHRRQVLDLFTDNGPQSKPGIPATTSPAEDSCPEVFDTKDSLGRYNLDTSSTESPKFEHGQDDDEEEEFPEVEFEEVDDVLFQEEDDPLETLARKIGM